MSRFPGALRMIGLSIPIILLAPKDIWGYLAERWNLSLFPTSYRGIDKEKP